MDAMGYVWMIILGIWIVVEKVMFNNLYIYGVRSGFL